MNARQRRIARRAWQRAAERHAFGGCLFVEPIRMPADVLCRVSEYSTSIPTGAKPGRIWRLNLAFGMRAARKVARHLRPPSAVREAWYLATVLDEPHPKGGHVIRYQRVRLVERTGR